MDSINYLVRTSIFQFVPNDKILYPIGLPCCSVQPAQAKAFAVEVIYICFVCPKSHKIHTTCALTFYFSSSLWARSRPFPGERCWSGISGFEPDPSGGDLTRAKGKTDDAESVVCPSISVEVDVGPHLNGAGRSDDSCRGGLGPPPLLGALGFELANLRGQGGSFRVGDLVSDGAEDLEVLLLEIFESRVQLLVPRVQHKHLEAQRRAGHHKVGHRNGSRDDHGVRLARDSRDSAGGKRVVCLADCFKKSNRGCMDDYGMEYYVSRQKTSVGAKEC